MPAFSTTLTADMGAADLIASVADNTGARTTYPWRASLTAVGSGLEYIEVVGGVAEGLDWDIRRGQYGSDPLNYVVGDFLTIYTGDLADVLRVGTDTGSAPITVSDGTVDRVVLTLTPGGNTTLDVYDTDGYDEGSGVVLGRLKIEADGRLTLLTDPAGATVKLDPSGLVTIQNDAFASILLNTDGSVQFSSPNTTLTLTADGDVTLDSAVILLPFLPTSDPTVAGALWVDTTGGFNILKVSL